MQYRNTSYGEGQFDTYWYEKNLQGDVMRIVDTSGTVIANYFYDAWGKVTSSGNVVGQYNPIRYRGYYYDTDTGFYYLQSRYYDPVVKRFISADDESLIGANGDFISLNLYAYCLNNPIDSTDSNGHFALAIIITGAVVGGLLGAFSAVTTEENVTGKDIGMSIVKGALTGALGSACGLMASATAGIVLACVGGAVIDFGMQVTNQYMEKRVLIFQKLIMEKF